MLNPSKAFSSFSVNDIQKTKEFYGKTLGLEVSSGPEGTLVVPLSAGTKALMYPQGLKPVVGEAERSAKALLYT